LYLIFLLGGYRAGGKGVCGRLMSPAHETQSMREIRLLRGRLPWKGGGLTGMCTLHFCFHDLMHNFYIYTCHVIVAVLYLLSNPKLFQWQCQALFLLPSSSVVWRLFVRLAGAMGRQSALHKENNGFAAPTHYSVLARFVTIRFYFLSETLI
jgi:hypothetical protein